MLERFQLIVESNFAFALVLHLTTLYDWLTKLKPLSQPMGIQTKTNRVFAARLFPRLAPVTCICFEFDWLVVLFTSVVIGQSNYFGFGFTIPNGKPLYLNTRVTFVEHKELA